MQNDMSTAAIRSKSKPDLEFQYGGRLGVFACHPRDTCHISGCNKIPPPPHIENRFSPHFIFLNAVWLWRAAAFVSSPIHVFMHVTRRLELFRSTRLLQSFCICCRCTCHIDTTSCVAFVKYRSSWAPTHGHVAVSYKLSAYDTQNSHNCVA